MFGKVLIANRGEIAVRVARTCRELGIATVAVFSDADARARHREICDEAVRLPGVAAADTYLDVAAIVAAARATGAEAIHPGYGFLSEQPHAARAVADAGLTWVGPPPEAVEAVGDKLAARRLADAAGVPFVPGTLEPVSGPEDGLAFGRRHGYPIAVKAVGGGGGRGLKVAGGPDEVARAIETAAREATAYFGWGDVYLERYLTAPKHVEIQILAPRPGEAAWLGARDCSLQRRHQKLVEETPPPRWGDRVPAMGEAAVAVANACGYVNAGTVEFLVDDDGAFYFLEVNARLQVEHTVTEEVLGIDLVAAQLRIAAGEPLGFDPARLAPRGHAIECRINAEDPARDFAPSPGRIGEYREPGGPGVRVDSGFGWGDAIPEVYDNLIAKLVVWAPDREAARRRMLRALDEFRIEGVPTTIPAHRALLESAAFAAGSHTTRTLEQGALGSLDADAASEGGAPAGLRLWHPAIAPSVRAAAGRIGGGEVPAPMHGTILQVLVAAGDRLQPGDPVAVLEAMKMETHVTSAGAGLVTSVHVGPGSVVEAGDPLATVAGDDETSAAPGAKGQDATVGQRPAAPSASP